MSTFVSAIYRDRAAAEVAAQRLIEAGCSRDDISILMSDATRGRDFSLEQSSKAPEGAAAGAVVGGAIGAIAAGLVAVGSIAAPGIGLVAAGPIVATLAGAGAGGAAGGLVGALTGSGIPEHEARLKADRIERGDILIGVAAHEDRVEAVQEVFGHTGGASVRTG